jgi:uncharacterized coiled-coil protein SlyX
MKLSTLPSWHRFEDQAALILAASKAKRGDGLRMEDIEGDDDEGAPGADDDEPDDDDDEDPDDDPDKKSGDDDKTGKKDDDKSSDEKVDRAEYERVKRHRAAADRRVAERDQTIADLQRQLQEKDTKADGTTQARVTELEEGVTSRDKTIHELRIQNAFLAANKYTWHDAADALRLADLSGVEIDPEDGSVTGLKEALDALAKSKPHLIKVEGKKEDPKGSSGSPNNGKRKGDTKKPDRASLSKTYPVLATRR